MIFWLAYRRRLQIGMLIARERLRGLSEPDRRNCTSYEGTLNPGGEK
jgi:hypothetical protein